MRSRWWASYKPRGPRPGRPQSPAGGAVTPTAMSARPARKCGGGGRAGRGRDSPFTPLPGARSAGSNAPRGAIRLAAARVGPQPPGGVTFGGPRGGCFWAPPICALGGGWVVAAVAVGGRGGWPRRRWCLFRSSREVNGPLGILPRRRGHTVPNGAPSKQVRTALPQNL